MQGDEYRRIASRFHAEKAGGGDANDGERSVVDEQRLPDGIRIPREALLPVLIADDSYGRAPERSSSAEIRRPAAGCTPRPS